ncbi:SusC/RagA family TonB-linked outer membrane protein [Polluticoccus soli]
MNYEKSTRTYMLIVFMLLSSLLWRQEAFGQQITVQGLVTDSMNLPLAGASIQVKGNSKSTVTDNEGKFNLDGVASAGVLVVSYIGYATQEVQVGNGRNLVIHLLPKIGTTEEVVVIGYGKQKKSDLTSAVSVINMNKIDDIPLTNLSNGLAGRAPGVTIVSTSGLAGASSSIRIRGNFNDPLIVIDGIVKDKAAFDALDPNEISQFTTLKDAAATSVYGAAAGNGVIVITTKKGVIGKPTFSAQVSTTTQRPTQTVLADQSTATDELIYQNRVTQFNNDYNNQSTPLPNDQTTLDYFKDKSYNLNDWIWRNPGTKKYLFSVEGGSDKITYFNLLSYTDEKGSYENLGFKKFNLRSNINAKLSDAISVNLNIGAAQQNTDRFYWPFASSDDITNYDVSDFYRTTFNWPKYIPPYLEKDGTPAKAGEVTAYPILPNYGSWLGWSVADVVLGGNRYIKARNRQFNPTLTVDVKLDQFVKGLSTKFVGNYEANDFFEKLWMNFSTTYIFNSVPGQTNQYLPAPPDPTKTNTFAFNSPQAPYLQELVNTGWKYQLDWYLNYDRKFGEHNISAMGVFEQIQTRLNYVNATAYSPISSTIDQFFNYSTSSGNRYGDGSEAVTASRAWIGRVHYDYAGKYIAEFAFRQDGRYEFAPGHRWGFFPAGSLAWNLSKESFFYTALPWIDNFKLRASYGTTGNPVDVNNYTLAAYQYQTYYTPTTGYVFGNTYYNGVEPTATPNPNITWATTVERNLGVDFAFLNNRLTGSFDIFKNTMKRILGTRTVTLPTTYGQELAQENYAQRTFRGWEYSLQWQDRVGKISYSVYGNMGYAIDRWDILDPAQADYYPGQPESFRYPIGHPADRIFGYQADGLVRTQSQLDALNAEGYTYSGRKPYLGAILYKDVRGQSYSTTPDNRIDGNDVVLLSDNGKPRINFGFGFNVSWNGFSIDAHFQGVAKYDRMVSNFDGPGMRQWGGTQRLYYPIWAHDVWTPEDPNAKYPRVTGQNWDESGGTGSSFWLRNGSYVRLKNLNIGYNLPAVWVHKMGMSSVQLFVNSTNLFTFSKMKEFMDPEQQNYDSYPVMKTFTAGLNIRF